MKIYDHHPHPHIESRKPRAPRHKAPRESPLTRFNSVLGERITKGVGTMWCAYAFALLAFISLPEAIHTGTSALISWIAQTFLQLVLLSIIMVGQKVEGAAADVRADDTYKDAEAILHEALEIQKHLEAQDALLQKLIETEQNAAKPAGPA
jgi:cobalamin biosynthesis protein CobD/CbiB